MFRIVGPIPKESFVLCSSLRTEPFQREFLLSQPQVPEDVVFDQQCTKKSQIWLQDANNETKDGVTTDLILTWR